MLMIRFQRVGKKKQPFYRFIVSEKHKDTQAGSLEILGHYNPLKEKNNLDLKAERIKHWLSCGAQASDTVRNLLVRAGVIAGEKRKKGHISSRRKAKLAGAKAEASAPEKQVA